MYLLWNSSFLIYHISIMTLMRQFISINLNEITFYLSLSKFSKALFILWSFGHYNTEFCSIHLFWQYGHVLEFGYIVEPMGFSSIYLKYTFTVILAGQGFSVYSAPYKPMADFITTAWWQALFLGHLSNSCDLL